MKKLKVFSISAILIVICCSFLFSASVFAASKKRNKFDHKPSGNIYYYDENGHTVKWTCHDPRKENIIFNEKGNPAERLAEDQGRLLFLPDPQRLLCLHGNFPGV